MLYIQANAYTMSQNTKHAFLTVQNVSELLQLSQITIYKYIRERKLEAIEFGGHYRIDASSLKNFIESHKVKTKKGQMIYEK